MAANDAILTLGTELGVAATGTTSSISSGAVQECTDDNRQPADSTGYPLAIFELDLAAGGFSAAPTAGAYFLILEQPINSDGNDAPDVTTSYLHKALGVMPVPASDAQMYFTLGPVPINRYGGKYWVYWKDGGAGTASVDSGWALRLIPCTYRPSAS